MHSKALAALRSVEDSWNDPKSTLNIHCSINAYQATGYASAKADEHAVTSASCNHVVIMNLFV